MHPARVDRQSHAVPYDAPPHPGLIEGRESSRARDGAGPPAPIATAPTTAALRMPGPASELGAPVRGVAGLVVGAWFRGAVAAHIMDYGLACHVTPAELDQMAAQQHSATQTPEPGCRPVTGLPLAVEVRRSLARLHGFSLLSRASDRDFVTWCDGGGVAKQSVFNQLAKLLPRTDAARQVVRASCTIAPSPAAYGAAAARRPELAFSPDGEVFLSQVASRCPDIFPVYRDLAAPARALFQAAYLPRTHLRHMLYCEGGENMFEMLREAARAGLLRHEVFEIWVGRWVCNLAGFLGHAAPGSQELNEDTARSVLALVDLLSRLRQAPNSDLLEAYLATRAKPLGLEAMPAALLRLACMMRLYHPDQGRELREFWCGLTPKQRTDKEATLTALAPGATTPTYEPALLRQLLKQCGTVRRAARVHDTLERAARAAYASALAAGTLTSDVPLSFRVLAESASVEEVLRRGASTPLKLEVGADGAARLA